MERNEENREGSARCKGESGNETHEPDQAIRHRIDQLARSSFWSPRRPRMPEQSSRDRISSNAVATFFRIYTADKYFSAAHRIRSRFRAKSLLTSEVAS
jgi:hypothetical protein